MSSASSSPAKYDYDLLVIGAGSGGMSAARLAAQYGKQVAIVEKSLVGGTCVNRGCVPTKLMVYAAEFAQQQEVAQDYGWVNPEGLFDWSDFRQAMDEHIQSIRNSQTDNLEAVDIIQAEAKFVDSYTLSIGERQVTAEFILIAVGSQPLMPDLPGIEHAITSRDIFKLETLPETILVAGGGYIGVEFSQIMKSFGCRVTLVDSDRYVLNGFDEDIQKRVKEILVEDGIRLIDGSHLASIEQGNGTLIANLDNGWSLKAQKVLCALGREANIHSLNLDAVGVGVKNNRIAVNTQGQTKTSNIFAIGDCTDKMLLTPVAKAEAAVAVKAMFTDSQPQVDYFWIPSAVFMQPEVATVGLTESEARRQHPKVETHCNTFTPLKYAITDKASKAFIKVVVNGHTAKILGIHLISPRAADIVQALVPALEKGLTKPELDQTVGIHPSVGEEVFAL